MNRDGIKRIQDGCTLIPFFEAVILNEVKDPCICFCLFCGSGTSTM